MSNFYKNNDKQFREKLTEYEFEQPSSAWKQMEHMLDQKMPVQETSGIFWWALPVAAAALMTGIIGLGVYLYPEKMLTDLPAPLAEQETVAPTQQAPTPEAEDHNIDLPLANLSPNKATNTPTTPPQTATTTTNNNNKGTKEEAANSTTHTTEAPKVVIPAQDKPIISEEDMRAIAAANASKSKEEKDKPTTKNKRFKKTRTIVRYQYSMTPFKEQFLSKREKISNPINTTVGTFGIGDRSLTNNKKVRLGIMAGVSTKMIGSTNHFSVMPTAALTANYRISPKHALQTGLQYKAMHINKSTKSHTDKFGQAVDYRYYHDGNIATTAHALDRVDVLEIPLAYQYYPHPQFNIQAGIKGSWMFNAQTSNVAMNKMKNSKIGLVDFDFGMLLGMEYLINQHWSIALQYSVGFLNLVKQGKMRHESVTPQDMHQDRTAELTEDGECLVPVTQEGTSHQTIRLPNELRNNDLQLLIKYTF